MAWVLIGLLLAFTGPLIELVRFAAPSDLYSHTLLVPAISGYLIWRQRARLARAASREIAGALLPAVAGLVLLGAYALRSSSDAAPLAIEDRLAFLLWPWLLLSAAVFIFFYGRRGLTTIAFPLTFLSAMIPLPTAAQSAIELFLQRGSAETAEVLFTAAGTPLFRDGVVFHLPGITLELASQCSGIHSTLVLFLTSLLVGHAFLRSPVHRAVLAVVVVPLALLRNGLRVFVLGELCVKLGPDMIHSPLHHRGGPLFFALSLLPLSLMLYVMARTERRSTFPPH